MGSTGPATWMGLMPMFALNWMFFSSSAAGLGSSSLAEDFSTSLSSFYLAFSRFDAVSSAIFTASVTDNFYWPSLDGSLF